MNKMDEIDDQSREITDNLITAHHAFRAHLRMLFRDTKDLWEYTPKSKKGVSEWSMQSTAVEILNYEIRMINKIEGDEIDFVPDDISFPNFLEVEKEISDELVSRLNHECRNGFIWTTEPDVIEELSYHYIMQRTIMHGIYHCGGVSTLRSLIGLKRADYTKWPDMVDSVFKSSMISDVLSHH